MRLFCGSLHTNFEVTIFDKKVTWYKAKVNHKQENSVEFSLGSLVNKEETEKLHHCPYTLGSLTPFFYANLIYVVVVRNEN